MKEQPSGVHHLETRVKNDPDVRPKAYDFGEPLTCLGSLGIHARLFDRNHRKSTRSTITTM
jgi:hypothetical protein